MSLRSIDFMGATRLVAVMLMLCASAEVGRGYLEQRHASTGAFLVHSLTGSCDGTKKMLESCHGLRDGQSGLAVMLKDHLVCFRGGAASKPLLTLIR